MTANDDKQTLADIAICQSILQFYDKYGRMPEIVRCSQSVFDDYVGEELLTYTQPIVFEKVRIVLDDELPDEYLVSCSAH